MPSRLVEKFSGFVLALLVERLASARRGRGSED